MSLATEVASAIAAEEQGNEQTITMGQGEVLPQHVGFVMVADHAPSVVAADINKKRKNDIIICKDASLASAPTSKA